MRYPVIIVVLLFAFLPLAAQEIVEVGDVSAECTEVPGCFNRLHPEIPMAAKAKPGATIILHVRNALDFDLDPEAPPDPRAEDPGFGTVHSMAGPVHIEGAEPGDVLKVRILDIAPGPWAFTSISRIGFLADEFENASLRVRWRLNRDYAMSDDLPGVRLPNRSFPGIVTVLPGRKEHVAMMQREEELLKAGGIVMPPTHGAHASPKEICGEGGAHEEECLRTVPPREHGGNMDIRYLQKGVSIYLPCYVEGCGLAVGDLHYTQGDGEVTGTALEMDGTVTLTTELIKDGPRLERGPHYEGPATLLDVPSRSFYATTGFPVKERGKVPPDMEYLESAKVAGLENLSKDVSLAARNALREMIDYITETYGYTREQAYVITSVAVDLRISQLVDTPNVGVTAILPLDIFENR
ncbi:MAG: acetamidase/formamidase family protein [Thermoanaerobaculia bacterium]|nr:acetamidase/formamidase family protein [Thermoanaerobaculia bacterium]